MQNVPKVARSSQLDLTDRFDLAVFACEHRYRLRNLHDGSPVPPARRQRADDGRVGYIGASDRCDAIVGYDGYLADDGEDSRLGIYLCYKSARGVKKARARIKAVGGTVDQVGDVEITGTVSVDRIEDVLKLIRVSKLRPGNVENLERAPLQNTYGTQNRTNAVGWTTGALEVKTDAGGCVTDILENMHSDGSDDG